MAIDDMERKGKSITMLFTAFGQGSEAERMAMYVQMLQEIPAEVLDQTCRKAILESKFLPSIAELLESARNLVGNGTSFKPFPEVWEEILAELDRTYIWDVPQFSTKEIEKLVRSFGWEELRYMETKNVPIIRAQMRDMYNAICEQAKETMLNQYVVGQGKLLGGEQCPKRLT